ncbi:hypothetical protein [Cellvibrio mixtus]|uniref:hypothetical protein n=1 Tax=Cellvibrio mixtus TaxID=39650 RepID=UPI00114080DF|nr:hypothetical protein [Cellvibrio mixtus]
MSNPLQGLKIDYWYKAVLVISTALLIISLTVPLQGVSNSVVALICVGSILIGLGEWINHPYQEKIGSGFKISGHPRSNSFFGVALLMSGIFISGYGVYQLL